jgi:CBS domain containing-hemolysin-like protein
MSTILGLLSVFVLVFMNGFFVAAEFAFVGARRTRIAQLAEEGHTGAKYASRAIQHLDTYIAATQLGITLASLGLGWIGEPALAHIFEPILGIFLSEEALESAGHAITLPLAFALVTMFHIVLGELAPKSIALQRPEGTSVIVSRPMIWFNSVFRPVIITMNAIGNGVVRLLGFEPAGEHSQVHSVEELAMLVESSRQAGLLDENEEILLRRVFDFGDIYLRETMQPRVEVEAFPVDMPLSDLLGKVAAQHHSRYPVYRESLDSVIGVLYTKDLLDALIQQPDLLSGGGDGFPLESILRAPLFIPQTVRVDKVLERMQRTKVHLAVVLDEYGGMAGMATMEDILEQLIGEVEDEFDVKPEHVADDGDVLEGLTTIGEAIERFGDPGIKPISSTIGGYVAERLERIPVVGDRAVFGVYDVVVEAMDEMRVARVRFVRREQSGQQF